MNLKEAKLATGGGLLTNSKMPGYCYSIPAKECNVGAKLVKIAGSVCEGCYALKGFYQTYATSIDRALYARLDSLTNPLWVEAMSKLINHYCQDGEAVSKRGTFFRWDAAGDGSETCQATMPENKSECGDCRACWKSEVANVSYAKH